MKSDKNLQARKQKLIEALMAVTDEALIEKLHIVLQQGKKGEKSSPVFSQELIDSLDERWTEYKNAGTTYSISQTRAAAQLKLKTKK